MKNQNGSKTHKNVESIIKNKQLPDKEKPCTTWYTGEFC